MRMVEIRQELDGEDRTEYVPESAVPFWTSAGWAVIGKAADLDPAAATGSVDPLSPNAGETEPEQPARAASKSKKES